MIRFILTHRCGNSLGTARVWALVKAGMFVGSVYHMDPDAGEGRFMWCAYNPNGKILTCRASRPDSILVAARDMLKAWRSQT